MQQKWRLIEQNWEIIQRYMEYIGIRVKSIEWGVSDTLPLFVLFSGKIKPIKFTNTVLLSSWKQNPHRNCN
jgi:hypothetical protein